jgi:hypothetical protein
MENKKHKQEGLKEQVHSEFETSDGNSFNTVREELVKKQEGDEEGPLNQVPAEDAVKNDQEADDDVPKMKGPEGS